MFWNRRAVHQPFHIVRKTAVTTRSATKELRGTKRAFTLRNCTAQKKILKTTVHIITNLAFMLKQVELNQQLLSDDKIINHTKLCTHDLLSHPQQTFPFHTTTILTDHQSIELAREWGT